MSDGDGLCDGLADEFDAAARICVEAKEAASRPQGGEGRMPLGTSEPLGIIACGAIARELVQLGRVNGWRHFKLYCLPADLHNRPAEIPAAVAAKIDLVKRRHRQVLVGYGDCGTGGALDVVLEAAGVERLPGAHCYEFLAGAPQFDALMDDEPGSFFLTDFLVRHFDRLIHRGLGLDRFPELLDDYFGNYTRVVHLAQSGEPGLREAAAGQAGALKLAFEYRYTGYGPLSQALATRHAFAPVADSPINLQEEALA